MKHVLPFFLAGLMTACALTACGGGGDKSAHVNSEQADESTTAAVETVPRYTPPEKDYGGRNFNILLRPTSWTPQDLYAEESTGEAFNDAVFNRNARIAEEYNAKIVGEIPNVATGTALNAYVQSFVAGGDNVFDLTTIRVSDCCTLAQTGIFYDLLDKKVVSLLDFKQDFWQYDLLMETTVINRLYYATGLATNAADALNICFFNKDLAKAYKLDNMYDLVKTGKFTLDKMYSAACAVAKDLNGDGAMTVDDQFGVTMQAGSGPRMWFFGAGEVMTKRDDKGIPYVSLGENQRAFDVFEKIQKYAQDRTHLFLDETAPIKEVWFGGRGLFYYASLNNAPQMRDYDFDFGILPMPKYDEQQEEYWCYLNAHNPCGVSVPLTANFEESALMLQVIAYYSQDEVVPAYYDVCLTGKSFRDAESAEMLDIIFTHWRGDFADAYAWGGLSNSVATALVGTDGLASTLAARKDATAAAIDATIKVYQALE